MAPRISPVPKPIIMKSVLPCSEKDFWIFCPKEKNEEAMKKFSQAEKAFQQAVAVNPESAESHRYLARTYSMQNKLSAATKEYMKTIEIEPNNLDNYLFLASIYVRMKRYDDALNLLNHAKTLTGESAAIDLIDDLIHNIRERSLEHYQTIPQNNRRTINTDKNRTV